MHAAAPLAVLLDSESWPAVWLARFLRRPRLLLALGLVALALLVLVLLRRRRARRRRERAVRELEEGRTLPYRFGDRSFRAFVPVCPEAEGIFLRAFQLTEGPRLKLLEPGEEVGVRFPSPNRPTYGYSRLSASYTLERVQGTRLLLALKGRGKRTFVVREGWVSDHGHPRDLTGMLGEWRPGWSHVRLYRHFDEGVLPLDELLERIDYLAAWQRVRREDLERRIAAGEPIDLTEENLFGVDLSGLDLSGVTSIEGADLRYTDVRGTVFARELRWLRRPWLLRWPRHRWHLCEGTRFREANFR